MSKIVFFTWPGGGNQPPVIGLAQHLRRRGHTIVVAGYPDQVDRFAGAGFDLVPLPGTDREWGPIDPSTVMDLLVNRVWACPDHLPAARTVLERERPDLVIVDCLMAAVLTALEATAVPTLVLVHSAPGALVPPGGVLDQLIITPLNALRANEGFDPVETLWSAWQTHAVACTSIPELDPLAAQVPDTFTWLGPVFETSAAADAPPQPRQHPDDGPPPLVLVSFSSGAAWDQTSRIQRTIDGLLDAGVRLVVTSGAVDPARLHLPTNAPPSAEPPAVTVLPYQDHASLLPQVAAVVSHAGHGTLAAALAHGLPVVTIPNLAADQPALSVRTAQLGAGIHLDESAEPHAIRDAVLTVLQNPEYRDAAGTLARRIEHYRQQSAASMEIVLTSLMDSPQRAHQCAMDATEPVEGASAQRLTGQR
jgi:UDP:flavonoid glycosyltransferase YjiC (YdhE family)